MSGFSKRWSVTTAVVFASVPVGACGGENFALFSHSDAAVSDDAAGSGGASAGGASGSAAAGKGGSVHAGAGGLGGTDAPADASSDEVSSDAIDVVSIDASEADAMDAEEDHLEAGDAPDGDATDDVADAGDPMGCADGTIEQDYGDTMHGCDGMKSQCEAESLCASGWHLCTLGEYGDRGGNSVSASVRRWLASCIREGCGSAHDPTTAICTQCTAGTAGRVDTLWDCTTSAKLDDDGNCWTGVVTWTAAGRVGSLASACLYVQQYGAIGEVGATCCQG